MKWDVISTDEGCAITCRGIRQDLAMKAISLIHNNMSPVMGTHGRLVTFKASSASFIRNGWYDPVTEELFLFIENYSYDDAVKLKEKVSFQINQENRFR
ncbi:MAG: hypothetical protein KatS3mg054_0443 [Chloroflexus sp.]|nr:MAG: hypothetical protein KatS3mg054_0208 [Chloroflexus sp.]GIV86414.1 MAG: hypothetical protein KatS3mg054_0443 [Chloroflexus sp.]